MSDAIKKANSGNNSYMQLDEQEDIIVDTRKLQKFWDKKINKAFGYKKI